MEASVGEKEKEDEQKKKKKCAVRQVLQEDDYLYQNDVREDVLHHYSLMEKIHHDCLKGSRPEEFVMAIVNYHHHHHRHPVLKECGVQE